MVFYLITPLLMAYYGRSLRSYISMSVVVVCMLCLYAFSTGLLDYRLLIYLPTYLFGIICADRKLLARKTLILFMGTAIFISVLAWSIFGGALVVGLSSFVISLSASYLIHVLSDRYTGKFLKIPATISFLSASSYCMYLFHRPIFILLKEAYFPIAQSSQVIYLLFIGVPLVVILSYFLQYQYDCLVGKIKILLFSKK